MQILVDTHTHTVSSGHAYSTLLENAEFAAKNGLKMFCTTDHAPSMPGAPHFWFFANQRILPRFLHNVAIIRGVEANILNQEGDIDLDQRIIDSLDWVIGSFHEPIFQPADKASHTQALINAISSGNIDAVGHPGNPHFDFDFEMVLRQAANHNVAIEVNNSSLGGSRVGSAPRCSDIIAMAKELDVFITTGSDAHFAADVGNFTQVKALLKHHNFPQERVITNSPDSFLSFLELRGKEPISEFSVNSF
ncbi:TPA: phosphatase [Photobacterium damselae]|uniref:Polymerase/histidinol phosphatase N-terminal domain-containing protein n=4 Tax=Photobacterium damselae TaxID=38293 RepID=D0Z3Y6_PHODD|nr:phosphatase [Photobacterium damselae]AWK84284.1 phosphatase [Photobacterium damselae]EEZ40117.1 hypothetical protein VDA_001139 [Photobacterium damselae subsp. damselae CIP 102761]KAB1181206.1 phosphatase [Photobacterium damselae subsp. damselae]KAB1182483.1 phosphatase [Photobacterium damselae subsp. damselae]MBF7098659.1 phosphatase [Photobacterium damselae]